MPVRHHYGSDPSQFAELHEPAGRRRDGAVVLMHGGFWRAQYGLDHLAAVAADLADRGWVVWNVEYRRVGNGGGYPATLEDTAQAIDYLATLEGVDTRRVVGVGHSAGGHLVTWAAGRIRPAVTISGVISLAGIVDLATAARERIGNGAAFDFVGGDPQDYPDRYARADPLAQVPIPAIVRCVHPVGDDRVPLAQSVTYVETARAAGQDARLLEVDGDHFSIVDVNLPSWQRVVGILEELTSGA